MWVQSSGADQPKVNAALRPGAQCHICNDMNDLKDRDGLPEALRALLQEYPRAGWEAHPEFGHLTRFWLDRHLGFRRLMEALRDEAEAASDGRLSPEAHAPRLGRMGNMLLGGLHEHHGVEDHHYFPRLSRLAPELGRGFEILDADHHALDAELAGFADAANGVLQGGEAGPLAERLAALERFLGRHLEDEEDLIVPVILRAGEGAIG